MLYIYIPVIHRCIYKEGTPGSCPGKKSWGDTSNFHFDTIPSSLRISTDT